MNLEKGINPGNLIYKYETDEISPKKFRKDPIKLFKEL